MVCHGFLGDYANMYAYLLVRYMPLRNELVSKQAKKLMKLLNII